MFHTCDSSPHLPVKPGIGWHTSCAACNSVQHQSLHSFRELWYSWLFVNDQPRYVTQSHAQVLQPIPRVSPHRGENSHGRCVTIQTTHTFWWETVWWTQSHFLDLLPKCGRPMRLWDYYHTSNSLANAQESMGKPCRHTQFIKTHIFLL